MKNVLFLVVAGIVFIGCTSSPAKESQNIPAPVFDKPHAIVLDMWSYGNRYEDYVKVYSSLKRENITFNVYGYNTTDKTWTLIGPAILKRFGDRDTIDSPLTGFFNGELNRFRWFVIHSLDNLDFSVQVVINNNDIILTVFEE
jgi:hypothetical protein